MPGKKANNKSNSTGHLTEEDRDLWKKVSDTAKPLKKRPIKSSSTRGLRKTGHAETPEKLDKAANFKPAAKQNPAKPIFSPNLTPATLPQPTPGVDKRMKRRLGRGQMEIESRLDLHGKTQAQAHDILRSFLMTAQSRGHRTVLVITGKGGSGIARHTLHSHDVVHTPERAGVLMRCVPQWLNEPKFRELVVGYQPAHPKHGGGGALYIRIRRKRQ